MNKKLSLKSMVLFALLLALKIILSRLTGISFGIVKLSFGFIATALTGYLFGPYLSALAGILSDLLGFMLFPQGSYFIGFTLSSMLSGLLFGLFLHKKRMTILRLLSVSALEFLLCSLFLNTLWTSLLYGKSFLALLPIRLIKNVILLPIQTLILWGLFKYLKEHLKVPH